MKPRPVANPKNRFLATEVAYDPEHEGVRVEAIPDRSRSVVTSNDSPDVGFSHSVNPYRGCQHACAYCYARPTHEYLGFGAGTDFDTRILVKERAPELLEAAFERPSWKGDAVIFSGVTDCYQPLEAKLRLTRRCLEVCARYKNPVGLITKAPLVERDVDVLAELQRVARVHVSLSIPFWDPDRARAIEPFVATPQRRLQAVETLAKAGVSVGVMVAPLIPGLNDEDLARVLEAAKAAGAVRAGYVLLRLPGAVKEVFEARVRAAMPDRADRILHRIRETRGGALYDARFGVRGRGEGAYAEAIEALFDATARRLGLDGGSPEDPPTTFARPEKARRQLELFARGDAGRTDGSGATGR